MFVTVSPVTRLTHSTLNYPLKHCVPEYLEIYPPVVTNFHAFWAGHGHEQLQSIAAAGHGPFSLSMTFLLDWHAKP